MKKFLLLFLTISVILGGCKKDESDVKLVADFSFIERDYEPNEAIRLENASKNAESYKWSSTGLHSFSSTDAESPIITYKEEGYHEVTLRAISKTGEESVKTKGIIVEKSTTGGGGNNGGGNTGGGNNTPPKSFTIKNLTLTNYPTDNFGFGDDPDVFFKFVDSHDNVYYDWGASNRINNATGQALKFFNLNYTAYVSAGTYYLQLIDYDPIPPNQTMGFCGFNLGNHNQNPSTTINVTCSNGISYTLYGTWNY